MRRATLALPLALLAFAAAGGGRDDAGSPAGAMTVVATTQQLADFARRIGGDRVTVDVLVPPRLDPHDFEPKPSDARAVARAAVVLRSGGELDGWLGGLLDNAGGDAERLTLLDEVPRPLADDPHWWQDPRNVVAAVDRIRAALAEADPDGRATYARNARRYADEVRALDDRIARCLREVDADRRKLVTGHDSFGYFAARYDVEILGSVIPARSTAAQPSAGDVRRLVAAIRREDVTTIFPESALNQRLEDAVAREAGAKVGEPLYADTLGPDGKGTYLGALRHDAALIAQSFGADCSL